MPNTCHRLFAQTLAILLAIALWATACSGAEDPAPAATNGPDTPVDEPGTSAAETPTDSPYATEQLGFDDVDFTIPDPSDDTVLDPAADVPVYATAGDLIDAGVASGAFTEIEGVRAVVSVVMSELSVESVPGLDLVPSRDHPGILDRAERLLQDQSVDAAQRADLARLTAFFFADDPRSGATATDSGTDDEEGAFGEVRLVSLAQSTTTVCQLNEALVFGATETVLCYKEFSNDEGDTVLVADTLDASDQSDRIFELIELARSGYLQLAGSTLPTVRILLSTDLSPPDAESAAGGSAAHVLGHSTNPCRVAVFADTSIYSSVEFDYVLTHELFHCVQNTWGGSLEASPTVQEGGATYFSQRLLDTCATGLLTAYGPRLDASTINTSVLDTGYASWYFWRFLDDHGHLGPNAISAVHQQVAAGDPLDQALLAALDEPAEVLNEFYVRMVGPGLACGLQGAAFLGGPPDITAPGPVDLASEFWVGTRYLLTYVQRKHFEQRRSGVEPMGMAEFGSVADASAWTVLEPDIRTRCNELELWAVVVTAPNPTTSAVQTIDVDTADDADCDPCLLGSWTIELATMSKYFEGFAPDGANVSLDGDWTLEFTADPSTMSDTRNLAVTVSLDDLGIGGPATQVVGSGSGSFSSDGSNFSVSGFTDSTQASVGGWSSPWSTSTSGGATPYTCDETTLTFQMPGDDLTISATRQPVLPKGEPYFG